jgi:RNAse (barnase) inhibitor barstar
LNECDMPYIWNTQTLLIIIGLQMRLINANNHGTLQSKIHQKPLFYRCFKETFEFEKKYSEILDYKYLFDFCKQIWNSSLEHKPLSISLISLQMLVSSFLFLEVTKFFNCFIFGFCIYFCLINSFLCHIFGTHRLY